MLQTPNLSLQYIDLNEAQREVVHNNAVRGLDALVQLAVLDRDLASPPGSPADGQRWIVAASPTGAWAGHANHVAAWQDGAWRFYVPRNGWLAYLVDEGVLLSWSGSAWVDAMANPSTLQNILLLGLGTTADATNPLSAKLNNALWTAKTVAEGGDGNLRYKMSKESAAKTLSLLMQTNFSGRAEIGLAGDDDLHFKVSADGSAWTEALLIDRTTGATKVNTGFSLTGDLSPAQITADQNDYNPTGHATASVLRLSSDASRNLTGLAGGSDGRLAALLNVGSFNVVLKDASPSSSAANRFAFGADVTLAPNQGALLIYDATSARWRAVAAFTVSGGGGSGTVTSVAVSVSGAGLSVSGSPVTTNGTITLTVDAELAALAGLTSAANKLPYFTGSGSAAVTDFTAAGRALLDDADAAAQRATLGAAPLDAPVFTTSVTLPGDPGSALQAATKQYVDSLAVNVGKRGRVRAATTANIAIATALNNADTLDGVTLSTGDLVLVKDQSAAAENGVYVVGVSPARASEFDTYNEHSGALIAVAEGTAHADTLWLCTANDGGTLDTTAITFAKMVIAGELLAANNLSDVASAATARSNLGLAIGSNVQAFDAELAALAGLTSAADKLPYFTGSGTAALADFTTTARSLLDDGSTSAMRTTLGLGTAATQNTGTAGGNVPLLNAANTWSGAQSLAAALDVQQNAYLSGDISPAQITADQNDYNPTGLATASVLRLSSDATRNITGLQGGTDGRVLVLINVGSNSIVLKNGSTGSSAANRFDVDADIAVTASKGAMLIYDGTASRWRCIGEGTGLHAPGHRSGSITSGCARKPAIPEQSRPTSWPGIRIAGRSASCLRRLSRSSASTSRPRSRVPMRSSPSTSSTAA